MRIIKFRGKSICEDTITTRDSKICKGDWVYGSLIVDSQPYIVGEIADVDREFIAPEFWIPVDEKTVGQFTGLLDKNGVEIYEGDIVCDENDVDYFKSISHKELLKVCDDKYSDVIVVGYGLEEVDAFYGMAFNVWSFNGYDKGDRLSREHIVIGNIHEEEMK